MTRLGIMQPYLFPYIGYFQLISAADLFVIADDVQWITGGWINRNRILTHGKVQYITLPLHRSSRRLNINKCRLGENADHEKTRILRRLKGAYQHAPYFDEVYDLVERCFANSENNVSLFTTAALVECCRHLGITTPFIYSSELGLSPELRAEARVIEINRFMKTKHYINPIGGMELYNKDAFIERGLQLSFLKTQSLQYEQASEDFVPNLSIIDVLMFNSVEETENLLSQFELV